MSFRKRKLGGVRRGGGKNGSIYKVGAKKMGGSWVGP